MPRCRLTQIQFELSELEKQILKALGAAEPSLLPALRLRHRLTFRNERTLYKRQSSLSGKSLISIYAPDSVYPVYAIDEWWSDTWDGIDFGLDFDFSRPFFEQFSELQRRVPRIALFNINPYNSDYCQQAYSCKNSYLCTVVKDTEDCLYLSHSNRVRDSIDCDYVQNVELCYDCLDSDKLYNCIGCDNCQNSHEIYFCLDCIGCACCIGCWGLRNQKYCILNEQVSKDDFQKMLSSLELYATSSFTKASAHFRATLYANHLRREFNLNTEECTGNYLINCANCVHCYDSFELERCANCTWTFESHHCADVYGMGTSEWVYESLGVEKLTSSAYNTFVSDSGMSFYSDLCFYCRDIFGCVGLRKKTYCILNKQYSAEGYQQLRDKIITHMKRTGEWGMFFPAALSPFAYNESVAQERFILPKEEALSLGYRWREADLRDYQPQIRQPPDDSRQANEELTKSLFSCENSGKNYRITLQELNLYHKLGVPLPRLCPDARYEARMARRSRDTS